MPKGAATLRALPSVDRLLRHPSSDPLLQTYPRDLVVDALRSALERHRSSGELGTAPTDEEIIRAAAAQLSALTAPSLRRVVNASGIVVHTNLGRALLPAEAGEAVHVAATDTCNLEYDIASGSRGDRDAHVEGHLCALSGAEAATAVNNNAAAVLLALNTLAEGREVVVSRGELIEIGGSFRIPEIMAKSGARLHEVGTTNRTHLKDYEAAIGSQTGLLLKVHTSNYRIEGFTAEVRLEDLVRLAHAHQLPVMEDLGSGALVDLSAYGLPKEPVVSERVRIGPDVVTFSGDKLLGGPQAGLLVGKHEVIERIRRNPLKRALRCDKMTIAALEATLRLYRTSPDLPAVIPTLRALTRPLEEIEKIGQQTAALLRETLGSSYRIELVDSESEIGSGALPTQTLATKAVAVSHATIGPLEIAARFRNADPPIIGRVHKDRFLLDLRCVWNPHDIVPNERSNVRTFERSNDS